MRVLFDTSAFYALVSKNDIFHKKAVQIYTELLAYKIPLYTTSYILVETIALIHHRLGFFPLSSFIPSIMDIFSIIWIDELKHQKSWEKLKEKEGKGFSFVDCSTLVLAEEINAHIFTFDSLFKKEKVRTIP